MTAPQLKIFWPLRLVAIATLVIPALAFGLSAWSNWRQLQAQTLEREDRALDVLQEQALNALQTVERSISEINEVLRGFSDEEIRRQEGELYLRFKRTQQALPQIESIWAFAASGSPLVSSTIYPVPQNLNNTDRSYFSAQKNVDAGTFISEVLRAKIGSMHFFVVSRRRPGTPPGIFNGIIGVTVSPSYFSEFYSKLSRGDDTFAIVREDGTFLTRFPGMTQALPVGPREFAEAKARKPEDGRFLITSRIDGAERLASYRKVPSFPIYVVTSVETRAVRNALWRILFAELVIGIPITVCVFGIALSALQRAERFEEESQRRAAAEDALKHAQRLEAVGRLTGGVAHDFNNLLMVVSGSAERLKRMLGETDASRPIAAIEHAVARGTGLTRQLLSFARRQAIEAKVVDLAERLPLLQEMLQPTLREDIEISVDVAPELWKVEVDQSELEIALINLAVNARDAMPQGGKLVISATNLAVPGGSLDGLEGDFVRVRVADTGVGIPEDKLGYVFEPFFTTKDVGSGTGLGLSQVYGFAKQSGGTALIESREGVGTSVSMYLPRKRGEISAIGECAPESFVAQKRRGKALLVEDNSDVASVVQMFLEELGYEVEHRSDVASAIKMLEDEAASLSLVVSDIVMPGGAGGLDLALWVRSHVGERLPVILATGFSDRTADAAKAEFVVLRKPFGLDELEAAISSIGDARAPV